MILKYKKILTFFAHPDDETLAAGATINKISKNGCRVYVAIPATGIHAQLRRIPAAFAEYPASPTFRNSTAPEEWPHFPGIPRSGS